jgi:hypothetical protein
MPADEFPKRALYREAGGRFMVDVLSDDEVFRDGTKWNVVRVRLVSVIRHAAVGPRVLPVGKEWTAEARDGCHAFAGWSVDYSQGE